MRRTASVCRFRAATLVLCLGVIATGPAPAQQPANEQPRGGARARPAEDVPANAATEVVILQHASANDVAPQIAQVLRALRIAVDERANRLVLSGAPEVIEQAQKLIAALDTPGKSSDRVTEFLRSPVAVTPELMAMIHTVISRDARISNHDQLVAVNGSDADVLAVRRVFEEVQKDLETAAAAVAGRPLRVSFSFLVGSIGPASTSSDGGSELPEALRPVATALRENGFGEAKLLAPVEVFLGDSGREFQLTGSTQRDDTNVELRLQGRAEPVLTPGGARPGVVRLTVEAKLLATRANVPQPSNPAPAQMMRNNLFELETTIDAPLGEYVVLAASPGSMGGNEAIALVVRVTEAK